MTANLTSPSLRFVKRFTNGFWRLLDLHEYREAGMFDLETQADAACERANLDHFAGLA